MKALRYLPFTILLGSCMIFDVRLATPQDESRIEKVSVPRKMRASGFADEEDLTPLCNGGRIVRVRFMMNTPTEIWCEPATPVENKQTVSTTN